VFEGDWVNESLLAAAALMVMLAEVPLILVSVTETVIVSALYKVIAPLGPVETAATPFVNVIAGRSSEVNCRARAVRHR